MPPVAEIVIDPWQSAKQVSLTILAVAKTLSGSLIITVAVAIHPTLSVTVNTCVPPQSPPVVAALGVEPEAHR